MSDAQKLYDGPSMLDGSRIVAIATGIGRASRNAKTGPMVQVHILRHDTAPQDAQRDGGDVSVCGSCPARPLMAAKASKQGRRQATCYVLTYQGPLAAWKANRDKPPTLADAVDAIKAKGRPIRFGAYGDPAAVPDTVWRRLAEAVSHTAYTHQWKRKGVSLQRLANASCDSTRDRTLAKAKGYRTARTVTTGGLEPGEIWCPATPEGGKRTTCAECLLCDGMRGPDDNRPDVAFPVHGKGQKRDAR